MKNWIVLVASLLAAAPLAAQIAPGKPAPDFDFENVWNPSSEARSLSELRGKPVLVEFWATWCGPCIRNIPHLNEIHREFTPRGLAMVAVSDEDAPTIAPFVLEHNMQYPVVRSARAGRDYRVRSIPAAFLVDSSGTVVWQGHPASLDASILEKVVSATGPIDPASLGGGGSAQTGSDPVAWMLGAVALGLLAAFSVSWWRGRKAAAR